MIKEELKEIIESLKDINSDTTHVEVKSGAGGFPSRIWETISAFANTPDDGIIIMGITETEKGIKITGLKNPAKFQSDLASICSLMVPPLRPLIEIHKYEGKLLLTAEIPEVSYKDKPCYYKGSGMMSGSFIRVADGDRQLTQYEIQGFLDGRGQPLYDIEGIPDSAIEDLDRELLNLFIEKIRSKLSNADEFDEKKILHMYRILTNIEDKEVVTLSGILCMGLYSQKYFPSLVVHVLVYPAKVPGQSGEQGERLIDNIRVEGPIIRAIPEAIKAIKRNLQKRTIVKGLFREDMLEYPEVFLREAVVNAIGHRDYSPLARGSAVQVKIFPDKIEIVNPGGLFGPVTEDKLGEHGLQATRNSYLMRLLEDIPVPGEKRVLCENRGTGISTMINSLIKSGMEPPQFQDMRNQFRVVCYNQALFDKDTLSWLEKYSDIELSERQRFSLAYIYHKGRLNNPDYCRMNDCDSRIATKELGELAENGFILQHGTKRWTYYTLKKKTERTKVIKESERKDRRKEIVDYIKSKDEVTREEIQTIIKMSAQTVLYWLRKLLKEKRIEKTTKSRKDPNVRYRIKKP